MQQVDRIHSNVHVIHTIIGYHKLIMVTVTCSLMGYWLCPEQQTMQLNALLAYEYTAEMPHCANGRVSGLSNLPRQLLPQL